MSNNVIAPVDRSKIFDENGNLKKVQGTSLKNKMKDWFIQGFQLNKCYIEHWDEIHRIFKEYGVDLNKHGPMLTIQTLKQVRIAKELTNILKKNPEIRCIASKSDIPLKTVIYTTQLNEEKMIEGKIFITLLRIIPEFCLSMGVYYFESFLDKKESKSHLQKVFSTRGTILDTESEIVKIVKDMIKAIEKNGLEIDVK